MVKIYIQQELEVDRRVIGHPTIMSLAWDGRIKHDASIQNDSPNTRSNESESSAHTLKTTFSVPPPNRLLRNTCPIELTYA